MTSKLVDGRIPAYTPCPFRSECPIAKDNACRHMGVQHKIPFSCASARGYDLSTRYKESGETKRLSAQTVSAITITAVHKLNGETVLETTCNDYEEYQKLPQVVSYEGIICGKTGWSSDRNYACYRSSAKIAKVVT